MWDNRARATLVGWLTLLLFAASCGGGDDDGELTRAGVDGTTQASAAGTAALPAREAPFDLAGLDLPDDVSEVVTLMTRLPASIDGFEQADPVHGEGDVRVQYGESESTAVAAPEITFRALNLASPEGVYPPNWTAAQVVERASVPGDDVIDFGTDGEIAWARRVFTVSASGSPAAAEQQEMLFGESAGSWVFSIQAADEELLGRAMAEFINAATDGP